MSKHQQSAAHKGCLSEVPERSEHLRLIVNLARRQDACSGLASNPPGRRCQREGFISKAVSLHLRGQVARETESFLFAPLTLFNLFGSHSSIVMGSRGGVPPNKAPLVMQSPAVHQQPRAFSHRWQKVWFTLWGRGWSPPLFVIYFSVSENRLMYFKRRYFGLSLHIKKILLYERKLANLTLLKLAEDGIRLASQCGANTS